MKSIVKNVKIGQHIMLNHQWIKVLEISYDKNSSISNAQIVGIGEVDGIKHEKNIKTTEIVQVK